MPIDTWLRIGAIGIPLAGALGIGLRRDKSLQNHRWFVCICFGVSGLITLVLLLHNKYYACTLRMGSQNCLFDGLATLSLVLLNFVLAGAVIALRGENKGYEYMLLLLLSSSWAGMGLAKNLLILLISLYLFFFVLNRWYKKEGFRGGFLSIRDDYEDNQK